MTSPQSSGVAVVDDVVSDMSYQRLTDWPGRAARR
jgi:hypothetical protein